MTNDSAKPIKTADSDRSYPIGIDPAAYEGDIVSRLRHWRGLHLAHSGELFETAADEIERLRLTAPEREAVAYALTALAGQMPDDQRAALAGLLERTPPTQPTPGAGSTP